MDGDSPEALLTEYGIERTNNGDNRFLNDNGSSWPLPPANLGFMLEVATLDSSLFALLEEAYDLVIEL